MVGNTLKVFMTMTTSFHSVLYNQCRWESIIK